MEWLMLGGFLLEGIGSFLAGDAKADAARADAAAKQAQAKELRERLIINEVAIRSRGERLALGIGGYGQGKGASIGDRAQALVDLTNILEDQRREGEFKARMLEQGADVDMNSANAYELGGILGGMGSIATGIAKTGITMDSNKRSGATSTRGYA